MRELFLNALRSPGFVVAGNSSWFLPPVLPAVTAAAQTENSYGHIGASQRDAAFNAGSRFMSAPTMLFNSAPLAGNNSIASFSAPVGASGAGRNGEGAPIDPDAIVEEVVMLGESRVSARRDLARERLKAFGAPALECIMDLLPPTGERHDHPDEKLRPLAAKALGVFDDHAAVAKLCALVGEDASRFVRMAAAKAISEAFPRFDYPLVATTMVAASQVRNNLYVRSAAVKWFAAKKSPMALRALFDMVEERETNEASKILFHMKFTADESLRSVLYHLTLESLSHDLADVRAFAVREIRYYRDVRAVPLLIERLRTDSDAKVVLFAARSLGELNDVRAIPALMEVASGHRSKETAWHAALALCSMEKGVDAKSLIKAAALAGLPFSHAGADAVRALRKQGPSAAAGAIEAVRELEGAAKIQAIKALGWIGVPEVVHTAMDFLKSEDGREREAVDSTFLQLGAVAVPELLEAMSDPVASVRAQAAGLLARIGDNRAKDRLFTAMQGPEESEVRLQALQWFAARPGFKPERELDESSIALLTSLAVSDEDEKLAARALSILSEHGGNAGVRMVLADIAAMTRGASSAHAKQYLDRANVQHLPWWQRRTRVRSDAK